MIRSGAIVDLYKAAGKHLENAEIAIANQDAHTADMEHRYFSRCISRMNELCLAHHGADVFAIAPEYAKRGWIDCDRN